MLDLIKTTGLVLTIVTGLYGIGDQIGYRPVWKWELDNQGFFLTMQRLKDRQAAGSITPRELGELCGLSNALRQKQPEGCEP